MTIRTRERKEFKPNHPYFQKVRIALVREGVEGYTATLKDQRDVLELVRRTLLDDADRETFVVIGVDSRNRATLFQEVTIGGLNEAGVTPREVFKPLIEGSCAAFIVAHNHPSGDPDPSSADRALTRRLAKCGALMGIRLLDHVIVGGEHRHYSFQATGEPALEAKL